MTSISYQVTDSTGNIHIVNTLDEAKRLCKEGGKYKQICNYTPSKHEAYCRAGSRQGGKQSGII